MLKALVAYKGKYAQILSTQNNKFELEIESDKIQKVRAKDFRFLHPNFAIPSLKLTPDFSILAEFSEELLTIAELSEWLFSEYTAESSWQTFLLVEEGLYFFWQQDKIFVRPQEQVIKIKQKYQLEAQEKSLIQDCITNIYNKKNSPKDLPILQEIEKVALSQLKSVKILKLLKIPNTPQDAHKLLVNIGYFDLFFNPYPARNKIYFPEEIQFSLNQTKLNNAMDLTHLKSYAIDNSESNDADDAISIDGNKIWVHIASVAGFINDDLLDYASKRVSNLYLADEVILMLPKKITQICALGLTKISNALSIGFELVNKQISNIEIVKSKIKVIKISYNDAEKLLKTTLKEHKKIADNYKKYRQENGSFNLNLPKVDIKIKNKKVIISSQLNTPARSMVAEFMILVGQAVAEFATIQKIPMPFVVQEKGDFSKELLAKENLSISESFASIRLFKRSLISINPQPHFGLGLDKYLRITSPLRRYLDLIAQIQLFNFIDHQKPFFDTKQIKKFIEFNSNKLGVINTTIRDSNTHYKLLYLLENKQKTFKATLISQRANKSLIMIDDIAMIESVNYQGMLDEILQIKFDMIDIFNQQVHIKVLNNKNSN